ncbi:hypothetical protein GOBAR_AA27490 [Gossypium barbadense]|uniref:Uncharacterized protein n=1 Tax=Gossypium barbadense TaxID=3634 RepID=A0A2P5WQ23_GOSBA|nr:hypothetical protein GOBAR_AA27490 [Gossypium barbadense]
MEALRSPSFLLQFIPEFLSLKQSEESEESANPSPVPHRHPLSTLRLHLAPRRTQGAMPPKKVVEPASQSGPPP